MLKYRAIYEEKQENTWTQRLKRINRLKSEIVTISGLSDSVYGLQKAMICYDLYRDKFSSILHKERILWAADNVMAALNITDQSKPKEKELADLVKEIVEPDNYFSLINHMSMILKDNKALRTETQKINALFNPREVSY